MSVKNSIQLAIMAKVDFPKWPLVGETGRQKLFPAIKSKFIFVLSE